MKAEVKRQVETDLKSDFDARFEVLQRRLKDRDVKISELENLQAQSDSERVAKEREIQKMKSEHERMAKMQEEKYKKMLKEAASEQEAKWSA